MRVKAKPPDVPRPPSRLLGAFETATTAWGHRLRYDDCCSSQMIESRPSRDLPEAEASYFEAQARLQRQRPVVMPYTSMLEVERCARKVSEFFTRP